MTMMTVAFLFMTLAFFCMTMAWLTARRVPCPHCGQRRIR